MGDECGNCKFVLEGHTSRVVDATFSPDGSRCLTASWDHTAKVWDAQGGQEIFTLRGHTDGHSGAVFSRDGSRILTFGRDKTARVWDALDGRQSFALEGLTDWVRASLFSPDGTRILYRQPSPIRRGQSMGCSNRTRVVPPPCLDLFTHGHDLLAGRKHIVTTNLAITENQE